jgi:hypothetical protein
VREVRFTLRIAPDVAGEPEGGQVVQRVLPDHPGPGQKIEVVLVEPEVRDALQEPAGAGHYAVPAAVRQPPGKGLEH